MPIALVDPVKRQWETSETGYMKWAVGQLVEKTKEEGGPGGKGSSRFSMLSVKMEDIGSVDGLRGLVEADHAGAGGDAGGVRSAEDRNTSG